MTDPQRYRHRTPEIEAVQWAGSNEAELSAFCSPFDFMEIEPEDRVEDPDQTAAVRESAHGTWRGLAPGDWVVKLDGGFFECSAADFAARYEPAAVPSAPVDRAAVLAEVIAHVEAMPGYPRLVLPEEIVAELRRVAAEAQQPETPRQWCKCPSCWGWFVEEHPGEDLDELGSDLGWWSGLPEHRDAPAVVPQPDGEA